VALTAQVAEKGKKRVKKNQEVLRIKKIEIKRETLRKLQDDEYQKVVAGTDCPSFSHFPHCPLCC
jgi:hypothetical protein